MFNIRIIINNREAQVNFHIYLIIWRTWYIESLNVHMTSSNLFFVKFWRSELKKYIKKVYFHNRCSSWYLFILHHVNFSFIFHHVHHDHSRIIAFSIIITGITIRNPIFSLIKFREWEIFRLCTDLMLTWI